MDDVALRSWIGRTERTSDIVTATPCAALLATLDREPLRPSEGTPLPPLWHWLYCLPLHRQSMIGDDGHARRGAFLPPVDLPRRMWAGGRLEFREPLRVGDRIERVSTIDDVVHKRGRSGALVFVSVRHEIHRNASSDVALTEVHDIVYREARRADDAAPPPRPAPATSTWCCQWNADEVRLFRYSALTFNGHRIHYDRAYVRDVEGYPGLVVHGPLLATLLVDLVVREQPHAKVAAFAFRALHPIFDGQPFEVCGEPSRDGRSVALWARDHAGALAMQASATLA